MNFHPIVVMLLVLHLKCNNFKSEMNLKSQTLSVNLQSREPGHGGIVIIARAHGRNTFTRRMPQQLCCAGLLVNLVTLSAGHVNNKLNVTHVFLIPVHVSTIFLR